MFFTRMLE